MELGLDRWQEVIAFSKCDCLHLWDLFDSEGCLDQKNGARVVQAWIVERERGCVELRIKLAWLAVFEWVQELFPHQMH